MSYCNCFWASGASPLRPIHRQPRHKQIRSFQDGNIQRESPAKLGVVARPQVTLDPDPKALCLHTLPAVVKNHPPPSSSWFSRPTGHLRPEPRVLAGSAAACESAVETWCACMSTSPQTRTQYSVRSSQIAVPSPPFLLQRHSSQHPGRMALPSPSLVRGGESEPSQDPPGAAFWAWPLLVDGHADDHADDPAANADADL